MQSSEMDLVMFTMFIYAQLNFSLFAGNLDVGFSGNVLQGQN